MYFSHFIAKQDTVFESISYKQRAHFFLFVLPVVLVTLDLQTGHLDNARISFIIIYYKLFSMTGGLNIKGTKAVVMVEE